MEKNHNSSEISSPLQEASQLQEPHDLNDYNEEKKSNEIKKDNKTSSVEIRIKCTNPIVRDLIAQNPAFKKFPISQEKIRDKMPHFMDPKQKFNIWSVLKDLIGKDLSKLAVPVWLNEPLSMLQRLTEQLEYYSILKKSNEEKDSCLRMAYVMGFSFSQYAAAIGRVKKPFNPILGETFDFIPEDKSFRFVAEQVSHHPPISAGHAESPEFEWWGDTNIKTSFWGNSFEAKTLNPIHIILKKHQDHITYRCPTISLQNIIIGTKYMEIFGEMPFNNLTTGESGQLSLLKKGWNDKNMYKAEGWIKDSQGKLVFQVEGKWNSYLKATDLRTNEEYYVWQRNKLPEQFEEQYSFSNLTKQLNHLNNELLQFIPATDCRLRPDQRAFEFGDIELAKDEKFRLEEKQRERRKEMKMKGEEHQPRWFIEVTDPISKVTNYEFKGGYWEAREKRMFTDSLDLFT